MIPLLVASLLFQTQGGAADLPTPTPAPLPTEVRDWTGFKYLPAGSRAVPVAFATPGDWSSIKGEPAPNAAVWRTKVVILTRVDRAHERGGTILWPGHHAIISQQVVRIRRALPQLRALVAHLSGGAVNMTFDVVEEPELMTLDGGDFGSFIRRYLEPRINGGRYEAEDGVFRGPYQSVFVVHPLGGEPSPIFEVQGTPVSLLGLPDAPSQEVDGYLAATMALNWQGQVAARAVDAGPASVADGSPAPSGADWPAILAGQNATTEQRLHALAAKLDTGTEMAFPFSVRSGERGIETTAKLEKDPERGEVLNVAEIGFVRAGGIALPTVDGVAIRDVVATPTFAFWAKSEARDPIVFQFDGKAVRLGTDVPFAYDNVWHRVKIDLRPLGRVAQILIAPDADARRLIKTTLGPVMASFAGFEATTEAPDAKPAAEEPSPTAVSPEARAAWAAASGPGDARRALFKDPHEAVRANAVAAAFARPDPADEPGLIESALFTFEPTIFTPALRALGKAKTPAADEALRRALRSAASDRARGLAAEILSESGDPKFVPLFIGLNQARSRAARLAAVRALGRIAGPESALMRMAYLPQEDPEIKLAVTLTADTNDDYQGRKLLWSAVNEPSDAVRLESLRRLSYSTVGEFATEGLKGVRDDSVGVRVGLLEAWAAAPRKEFVPAIRLALTDQAPRVRAAALDALAASSEGVEAKDVPFEDADPQVQLASLRIAKAKGITVPTDARERYRKSPDPKVRAVAGE